MSISWLFILVGYSIGKGSLPEPLFIFIFVPFVIQDLTNANTRRLIKNILVQIGPIMLFVNAYKELAKSKKEDKENK